MSTRLANRRRWLRAWDDLRGVGVPYVHAQNFSCSRTTNAPAGSVTKKVSVSEGASIVSPKMMAAALCSAQSWVSIGRKLCPRQRVIGMRTGAARVMGTRAFRASRGCRFAECACVGAVRAVLVSNSMFMFFSRSLAAQNPQERHRAF